MNLPKSLIAYYFILYSLLILATGSLVSCSLNSNFPINRFHTPNIGDEKKKTLGLSYPGTYQVKVANNLDFAPVDFDDYSISKNQTGNLEFQYSFHPAFDIGVDIGINSPFMLSSTIRLLSLGPLTIAGRFGAGAYLIAGKTDLTKKSYIFSTTITNFEGIVVLRAATLMDIYLGYVHYSYDIFIHITDQPEQEGGYAGTIDTFHIGSKYTFTNSLFLGINFARAKNRYAATVATEYFFGAILGQTF